MRTIAYVDLTDPNSKSQLSGQWSRIDKVHGGFVHKLGEVDSKDVEIGMRVETVFMHACREERPRRLHVGHKIL